MREIFHRTFPAPDYDLEATLSSGQAFRWTRRRSLLSVLESHPIGGQSQLVVASYAGRRLLICTGPGGASCVRDDPDTSASPLQVGGDQR